MCLTNTLNPNIMSKLQISQGNECSIYCPLFVLDLDGSKTPIVASDLTNVSVKLKYHTQVINMNHTCESNYVVVDLKGTEQVGVYSLIRAAELEGRKIQSNIH